SSRHGAVSVDGGTLRASAFGAVGDGTITNNAILEIANTSMGNTLTLNNGSTFRGTGAGALWGGLMTVADSATVDIEAPASGDVFTVGTVTNGISGGTGSTIQVFGNSGTGGGKTIFQTANTYVGGWSISDNTLQIQNASSLGSGTSAVVLGARGTLEISGATLDRAVTMNNL